MAKFFKEAEKTKSKDKYTYEGAAVGGALGYLKGSKDARKMPRIWETPKGQALWAQLKARDPNLTKRKFGRSMKGIGVGLGLAVGAGIGRYFLKDKEKNAQFKSRFGKFVGRQFEFMGDPAYRSNPDNVAKAQKYLQGGLWGGLVGGSIGGAYVGHRINKKRGDAPKSFFSGQSYSKKPYDRGASKFFVDAGSMFGGLGGAAAGAIGGAALWNRKWFASKIGPALSNLGVKMKNIKSKKDLKKAYYARQQKVHPDKPGGSNIKSRRASEAWQTLKNTGWYTKLAVYHITNQGK